MTPAPGTSAPPGAGLTRAAVTTITLTISGLCFAFCFGNAHRLCISLGIEGWIAWLIGPSVDLSVIGLLLGIRHLASLGYDEVQLSKPRRLLNLCGLLTLALNTADAITRGQFGTAAVEAIGPILLICWADVGPWLLRQIHTHPAHNQAEPAGQLRDAGPQRAVPLLTEAAPAAQSAADAAALVEPAAVQNLEQAEKVDHEDARRQGAARDQDALWSGALRLDAEHRASHGRPITRDALREGLNIGTNRATELNRRLREHTAHTARLAVREPLREADAETAPLALAGARS